MRSEKAITSPSSGRRFSRRTFGTLSLFALAGAQLVARPAAAAGLELKMQFASPDGTPWNRMDRRFAAQIEAVTGGRAKVQFFPPNSVTPFKDWLQATGAGVLDLGFVWHPILPGKFPQMELFSLPGLSKNQTIASVVYWRVREAFPEMGKLFTKADNVVELATFVAMGSHLHSREPIRTLADLKGKVFGAQDSAGVKVLQELGASAVVMVGSDAYLALQRGAIVGVLSAWGWVNNFKLNEVTTYHTLLNLNPGTYSSVMNRDTYDKLTPEEQQHLADITPLYFLYNTTDSAAAATAHIPPENIFTLSAEDQAELADKMRPQWDDWVKKADAMGMPGQKILDETVRLMKLYDQN
ncbi:TRAP-type C4-dicarboxylate transport system, substrate-binding protein [Tistlia consotensis]|uniref:TRAP-type C4-dicarboxylate transport system, substrate-binding protein n=1 Tax=Tistlia consotensis USBA 355 TaxID=560819 RepID=A0A1Y6C280_9PROT|nr:TRAP transporter substrate-binding protein DctP [Tistlia consotensis]SMF41455.1 TRAP-type C4-dicarboxylate transport system, substrate-binding protein [Tistlia consotensis USBA 355]SNR73740.1 TRAP-type C4-dicarboxylate transport system, substrate-binding protein [Tistlia consotensis]